MNRTMAVPTAVVTPTSSARLPWAKASCRRARDPSAARSANRAASRFSCPKAFTTRKAARVSWTTERPLLSNVSAVCQPARSRLA